MVAKGIEFSTLENECVRAVAYSHTFSTIQFSHWVAQEERCSAEVNFSSEPRTGDSEDEDVEDFASVEDVDDLAGEHLSFAAENEAATSETTKLVQELLNSEVVSQVHTPAPDATHRRYGPDLLDSSLVFPTEKTSPVSGVDGFCTPLLARWRIGQQASLFLCLTV